MSLASFQTEKAFRVKEHKHTHTKTQTYTYTHTDTHTQQQHEKVEKVEAIKLRNSWCR